MNATQQQNLQNAALALAKAPLMDQDECLATVTKLEKTCASLHAKLPVGVVLAAPERDEANILKYLDALAAHHTALLAAIAYPSAKAATDWKPKTLTDKVLAVKSLSTNATAKPAPATAATAKPQTLTEKVLAARKALGCAMIALAFTLPASAQPAGRYQFGITNAVPALYTTPKDFMTKKNQSAHAIKSETEAPATPTSKQSFQLSQATQEAVNRPAPGRRHPTPRELVSHLPTWLCGDTPPNVPLGDVSKCLDCWKHLRIPWQRGQLSREWVNFVVGCRKEGHSAQQGLKTIHATLGLGALGLREADRNAQTLALQSALDRGFEGDDIFPTQPLPDALLNFILFDGNECAKALRASLAEYQLAANKVYPLHSPLARADERKLAMHSSPNAEQSAKIAEEAAMSANPLFKELCANARHTLNDLWLATVRPLEVALIDGAVKYVSACKETSLQAEKDFFAAAGVDHEPTAVSKRFDTVLVELQRQQDRLAGGTGIAIAGTSVSIWNVELSVLCSVFAVELL